MKQKHCLTVMAILLLPFAATVSSAQSKIKDGTVSGSSSFPNSNAILELESNNKGLLMPRVELAATNSSSPLSAFVAGMTVYNTAAAGTGSTAVWAGHYISDGSRWIRIALTTEADSTKDSWKDDPANKQVSLAYMSDGISARPADSAFVINDNGRVGIGVLAPAATLDVNGQMRVRNLPNASNSDLNVLIPDADGDMTQTSIRTLLGNAGILVTAVPANNKWEGLDLGSKAARLTFVGRSAGGTDFTFEVFFDPSNPFVLLSSHNISSLSSSSSTVFRINFTGGVYGDFTFTSVGGGRYDVETTSPTLGWFQGTFFVLRNYN